MKKTITVFTTILFFLFTISAAFRPLSITSIHPDDHHVSNDAVLTTTKTSEPNDNDHQITATTTTEEVVSFPVEPETTTQTLIVSRPMNRPIRYSRSNQINRHFYNDHPRIPLRFVRRHPCRNYFHINFNNNDNQPSLELENSHTFRSDVVLASDDHVPSKWLKFKHEYGNHRHHHHDDDDNEAEIKYEVDGDKLQMHHYHHRRHHQHKGVGFVRAIRKFLKHAFD